MQLKTLQEFDERAERHNERLYRTLLWRERLERWIELLERHPTRILKTLPVTEARAPELRDAMRRQNSAITVAYRDPVLRAHGLDDDTYGAARRFFRLSHDDLHAVVCYCRYCTIMTAQQAAWQLRLLAWRSAEAGVLTRLWRSVAGRA